jgi:NADPH:quinone reductase-like Zn-dependent oxidoreductase/acyl transferase domain-containing protein
VPKLDAAWLPSLREGQDDWQTIAGSVSEFYVRGGRIDWRGWDAPWPRQRLQLPNYPFQRTRHWFSVDMSLRVPTRSDAGYCGATVPSGGPVHPLLGAPLSTVWTNKLFESRLSSCSPAYLVDHKVQGSVVTPAAAYIEQGLAAAEALFGPGQHGVANMTIQQAMFLMDDPEGGARARRRVQVSIAPESGGESTFETYSRTEDESVTPTAWTMHATGTLLHESKSASGTEFSAIDLEAARDRAVMIRSREEFYESMAERGLAYGPAFQVLGELHRGVDDAVASVELPDSVAREAHAYHLHPVIGDALLQAMSGAVPLEEDGSFSTFTYMPIGVRRVRVLKKIDDYKRPLFVYAQRTSSDSRPSPERVEADVCLVAANGEVLVAFEGAQVQRLGRSGTADSTVDTNRWLYEIAWREQPLAAGVTPATGEAGVDRSAGGPWLIFADSHGVARRLADQLVARGESCVLVEPATDYVAPPSRSANGHPMRHASAKIDPLDESHYRWLLEDVSTEGKPVCAGIVHLWSLDIGDNEPSPGPSLKGRGKETLALGCGGVLQLIRALSRASLAKQPSLWLVTAGAQAVGVPCGAEAPALAIEQSPLVGFGRVAALELPDLRPRLVDLDAVNVASQPESAAIALWAEIQNQSNDGEVAFREGKRYVARLARSASLDQSPAQASSTQLSLPGGPFQLRIAQAGSFDALKFVPVERDPPGPGQVEIEVRATGLNFSDVLKALGLYPGIKDAIVPLGIEASGVVTAAGEGVNRFQVGDEVLGVVPYAFASHARTAEYALVHKPPSIDHDAAATIPITFLTAYYGLVRLAQLQPGERVLIHAGAGGVGLAAIQIAQHIGAEVFATAGSDAKREFVRSLGVKHVYSSRSTAFADEILADTNREGVDVVLNSLPGEAISKSLSILRAYGRVLEIGKKDI